MINTVTIDSVLKLRRDNDYNYELIKDSFILADGEIILVDTAKNGLRAKIGDGVSTYAQLPFIDENIASNIIVKGYLNNNQFYYDSIFSEIIPPSINKIYLNLLDNSLYIYETNKYIVIHKIPLASNSIAGITKIYNSTGNNEDGTMSQKAITEELENKIELNIDNQNELLIFN